MNYPLAEAFTRTPSVVYQNLLREFWCTAIAYEPNPPADDSKVRPLKEYKIKFTVMNGKKPLTFDFKTFVESTGLDYNEGTYVSHPSPKAVKAELANIVENVILLDRTPVLKTAFPMTWRILFTFVDIRKIIYSDLVTRLTSKSRQKYVSYPRFVSCAFEVLLGTNYTKDDQFGISPTILSNSNFSKDPSKVTAIELTASMIDVNNLETSVSPLLFSIKKKKGRSQTVSKPKPKTQGTKASGSLPQKRKKAMTKKTTPEATETPPTEEVPTEDSDKTQGNVRPLIRDCFPRFLMRVLVKPSLYLKGHVRINTQRLKPLADMESQPRFVTALSETDAKYQTSYEVELDSQPLVLSTVADVQALLLSDDELVEESKDDVFKAGDEMNEDIQQADKEET
ncbi:hypothetical protein Tco_0111241 [Tanacetum coccineum]